MKIYQYNAYEFNDNHARKLHGPKKKKKKHTDQKGVRY